MCPRRLRRFPFLLGVVMGVRLVLGGEGGFVSGSSAADNALALALSLALALPLPARRASAAARALALASGLLLSGGPGRAPCGAPDSDSPDAPAGPRQAPIVQAQLGLQVLLRRNELSIQIVQRLDQSVRDVDIRVNGNATK